MGFADHLQRPWDALDVLHEQAYPLEQMREDAAAFYQQFYGISIDTEEITR